MEGRGREGRKNRHGVSCRERDKSGRVSVCE